MGNNKGYIENLDIDKFHYIKFKFTIIELINITEHNKEGFMNNRDLIDATKKILSGNGILFAGAGFSKKTTNINGLEPPLSWELSHKICDLMPDFEKDDDLMYVSDYYIKNNYDNNKLIKILKENFTIKNISQEHKDICNLNWKRVYTTNYDNTIKLAYTENGKDLQTISANDDESKNYNKNDNLCIHINGQING